MWLRSLTEHLTKIDAQHLVYQIRGLQYKDEKEFADSVLQVAMSANKETFDELKEDSSMCEALMELMRPEYEAEMKIATEEGMKQGMKQGRKQGVKQGKQQVLFDLVSSGKLDVGIASETLGITPEEFTKKFRAAKA